MSQDRLHTEYYLDADIYRLCKHFADKVVSTNADEYARRNQTDIEKIKYDILIGKLAEWGVYFVYLERGRTGITPPDMSLYTKEHKSFNPDLKWGLFNLHVKAQSYESAKRYGNSWLFQSKDPLFDYSNGYDIIVGCAVTLAESFKGQGAFVEILMEKPFESLVFGETKLSKLSTNKKAVYLKDNT